MKLCKVRKWYRHTEGLWIEANGSAEAQIMSCDKKGKSNKDYELTKIEVIEVEEQ